VLAAIALIASVSWVLTRSHHQPAAPSDASAGVGTAVVQRRTLIEHDTATGTLGYTDGLNVTAIQGGSVTWLPRAGTLIKPGQVLYRLDGQPTFLFDGSAAATRDFTQGMDPAPDVLELKRALRELGYDPAHQLTLGDDFDFATRAVIERWQQANHLPLSGSIPLGEISFQPGPRRVGQLQVVVGAVATAGELLFQSSSAERVVTGSIDASLQSELHLGDTVSVDLLDGTVTNGRISEIDNVATTTTQDQQQQAAGSGSSTPTLGFQVRLDHPSVAGNLDQAPVTINVARSRATNALSVPVTALLALSGGGYGVQVRHGGLATLVPVTTGAYSDNGFVQISGSGIRSGEHVVAAQ
jgi:peptidoglycan hydrolase-like protein with peptidoglycan-binding domain